MTMWDYCNANYGPEDIPAPEMWVECSECCGEGSIEKWEIVSRWSLDPPCAHVIPCESCGGTGGFLDEKKPDGPERPCPPIQMQEGECPF